jgi:4'-phosphopantetheinyl transferase
MTFDLSLAPDEVQAWWTASADAPLTPDLWAVLSASERAWAGRLRDAGDRARRLRARALLRKLLARGSGSCDPATIELRSGAHGKPELAGPSCMGSLHFNVSHSGALILIGVALDRAVGVDVERVQPDLAWEPVARSVFPPADVAWIEALPATDRVGAFFDTWVRREAYLKGLGEGLGGPGALDVVIPRQAASVQDGRPGSGAPSSWRVHRLALAPGYAAGLAVAGDVRVTVRTIEADVGSNAAGAADMMAGVRVHVDEERCEGHGRCYSLAPELFAPDEIGNGHEVGDGTVPPELEHQARLAVANCPERAIALDESH